ncbi:ADP-ribosylation [Thozetella sp. PMI_491]|nr:ADP-ribosylation [Thozetella sp. PMI_491]
MDTLWPPDPPGTISPAKLLAGFGSTLAVGSAAAVPAPAAGPAAHVDIPPATCSATIPPAQPSPPVTPRPIRSHLPRISSDWDPMHARAILSIWRCPTTRSEFDATRARTRRSGGSKARRTSHHGYFRNQTEGHTHIPVPVDPDADFGSLVVVDKATASIYDAYLLKVDIPRKINGFLRYQIVFSPDAQTYHLLIRQGTVGQRGRCRHDIKSSQLRVVVAKFRKEFRNQTGLAWRQRYDSATNHDGYYTFVELDYHQNLPRAIEPPNYASLDAHVKDEVRSLMEIVLYGGTVGGGANSICSGALATRFDFSAPFAQLSSWTIFSATRTLDRICKHLKSERTLHWKVILGVSSRYRSQIPFCAGDGRPPVISSYPALFLELRFLHSLWPRQETADMLVAVQNLGRWQVNAYKALAQPLYQAYSSVRHGFRRLTDATSAEFRGVSAYLEGSWSPVHTLSMELQDIYRVFIKSSLPNPYREWLESKNGFDICGEERLLLWHGTPLNSLLGILDVGLQIRRRGASLTGAMFGHGIYLADVASKSAGYCRHRLWGGEAVLLLCEADVGAQRVRSSTCIQNGHELIENSLGRYRSMEGLGRVGPTGWKSAEWEASGVPRMGISEVMMPDTSVPYSPKPLYGHLAHNEYVVYDTSHLLIRYLVRLKIEGWS